MQPWATPPLRKQRMPPLPPPPTTTRLQYMAEAPAARPPRAAHPQASPAVVAKHPAGVAVEMAPHIVAQSAPADTVSPMDRRHSRGRRLQLRQPRRRRGWCQPRPAAEATVEAQPRTPDASAQEATEAGLSSGGGTNRGAAGRPPAPAVRGLRHPPRRLLAQYLRPAPAPSSRRPPALASPKTPPMLRRRTHGAAEATAEAQPRAPPPPIRKPRRPACPPRRHYVGGGGWATTDAGRARPRVAAP